MNLIKPLKNRVGSKSDRGDSSLVSFIFIIPLFFSFLITMVDTSIYFTNRAIVTNAARDGARTVAIFGGAGTATKASPLEKSYGKTLSATCNANLGKLMHDTVAECNVYERLTTTGLVNTTINNNGVDCGPIASSAIGQETYCAVTWTYGGLPGGTLGFIKDPTTHESVFYDNYTKATSETEVKLNNTGDCNTVCVAR